MKFLIQSYEFDAVVCNDQY